MERIQSINPDRIQWCCAERGISLEQLASELHIPFLTLQKTIDGELGLTFNQLKKLASYFTRGTLFFLEQIAVDENLIHTPQFRTLTNQKPQISPKTKTLLNVLKNSE